MLLFGGLGIGLNTLIKKNKNIIFLICCIASAAIFTLCLECILATEWDIMPQSCSVFGENCTYTLTWGARNHGGSTAVYIFYNIYIYLYNACYIVKNISCGCKAATNQEVSGSAGGVFSVAWSFLICRLFTCTKMLKKKSKIFLWFYHLQLEGAP